VVTAGVQKLYAGNDRSIWEETHDSPDLSAWGCKHRSVVLYIILAVMAAGLAAVPLIGRPRTPRSPSRRWSSRSTGPAQRVTRWQPSGRQDRGEAPETPQIPLLDYINTYSRPGLRDRHRRAPQEPPPKSPVLDILYQVAKRSGTFSTRSPERSVRGLFFRRRSTGRVSSRLRLHRPDTTQQNSKRLDRDARRRLLRVYDVAKVVLVGDQPEKCSSVLAQKARHARGLAPDWCSTACWQNALRPGGSVETPPTGLCRWRDPVHRAERVGPFRSSRRQGVPSSGTSSTCVGGTDPPRFNRVRTTGSSAVEVGGRHVQSRHRPRLGRALDTELKAIEA